MIYRESKQAINNSLYLYIPKVVLDKLGGNTFLPYMRNFYTQTFIRNSNLLLEDLDDEFDYNEKKYSLSKLYTLAANNICYIFLEDESYLIGINPNKYLNDVSLLSLISKLEIGDRDRRPIPICRITRQTSELKLNYNLLAVGGAERLGDFSFRL